MANLNGMKVRQPKHRIMLRQENTVLRYVRKLLQAAQHKFGHNITRVADPVLRTCPAVVFFPEQRQRHVRLPQFAVHHRPIRHRPLFRRHRGRDGTESAITIDRNAHFGTIALRSGMSMRRTQR